MTSFRTAEATYLKLILSFLLAFQPLMAWAGDPLEPRETPPTVCEVDLTPAGISKILPEYRHWRGLFRDTTADRAFHHLREILADDLSANEQLAVLTAFLDREDSAYAEALTKLNWFSARYTRNFLSRSLDVSTARSRTLILGRGKPKSDVQLMNYLLKLSEKIALMPLEAQDWPRPWRNGLNTLKSPSRFLNQSMATLQLSGDRIERTYDQLRSIDPNFKSELFNDAPSVIEYRSIFAAVTALGTPLAAQAWLQHQVSPYWAIATSTLFAYTVFYAPLHGKLVRLDQTMRTRLKTYWITSNLVRALLLGTTLYTGLMIYRAEHSPEADAKGTVEAILDYFARSTGEDTEPAAAPARSLTEEIAAERAEIADYQKQLSNDPMSIELQLQLKAHEGTLKGLLEKQKNEGK